MVFLFSGTGTPGLWMQKPLQWSLGNQQPQMYTGMCSCRDCKNTVEIESDVKSDDERDECDDHGNSDAYDDKEDI